MSPAGDGPGSRERHERFRRRSRSSRACWRGEITNYRGKYLQLDNARLYDRPKKKPPVVIAAGGPQAAKLAAEKGDGLDGTEPQKELIEAYGGKGPRYCEVAMCCDKSEEKARETAHKYFRWSLTGWPVQAELPDTEGLRGREQAHLARGGGGEDQLRASAEHHLEAIGKFIKAGFDHIVLVQIGPNQEYFLELFEKELAPALRKGKAAK